MRTRLERTRLLIACLVLAACTGDGRFVSVGKGKDGKGGDADAAVEGGTSPEGGANAKQDGALVDAALDAAGDDDGGKPREIDPSKSCEAAADNNELALPVTIADDSDFSLTTGPTGFGLLYWRKGTCKHALDTLVIDAAGKFGTPKTFFDECVTTTDVALLWTQDGWRATWIDNFVAGAGAEVETLPLTDALLPKAGAMRTTLTMNTLVPELRPSMADVAGVAQLAWIVEEAGKRRIDGRRMDQADIVSLVPASAGHAPRALALTRMGTTNAALAWVEAEDGKGMWVQALDGSGKPNGDSERMSALNAVDSSVDVATRDVEGGAAIYTTVVQSSHEVRFRRLDDQGKLSSEEIVIVGSPLQARDASIARIAGGYVVAYRALPGGVITQPEIRVVFISKEGNAPFDSARRLVSYKLGDASAYGGRLTVRVSLDGQILVGFLDGGVAGMQKLRMLRQRLDCMN